MGNIFRYAFKPEYFPEQKCNSLANSQDSLDERLRPSALPDRAVQAPCVILLNLEGANAATSNLP